LNEKRIFKAKYGYKKENDKKEAKESQDDQVGWENQGNYKDRQGCQGCGFR
jgi:hypothetical protein